MVESKSIKKFKSGMIKELPFFPNDRATLNELEGQHLNDVLIHYLHWKTRIVPARPRKIIIAPEVTSDKRWSNLKSGVYDLLEKVRNGEDIYPYHSLRAHKKGYTPVQRIQNGEVDSWEDKDQVLNTKGFHHFHLNMNVQNTGLSVRTDDVLFAFVSRDYFHAIGVFNHEVFEQADINGIMTPERQRMWDLHEQHITRGMPPGTVYISNPITLSGHPTGLIHMCNLYTRIIREIDPKLDDSSFVNSLQSKGKPTFPNNSKLEWKLDNLDLGLLDKKNSIYLIIHKGHM